MPIDVLASISSSSFDERRYLQANPDVAKAVLAGHFTSGRQHYEIFGIRENRKMVKVSLDQARTIKLERIKDLLKSNIVPTWENGKPNFLTADIRASTGVEDTEGASFHDYDTAIVEMINRHSKGLLLDCGAGLRPVYYENVINYEIFDYESTDVIGSGEDLPFEDGSFDAVISVAVLEHVRNPFKCAQELMRVLKSGGEIFCCIPFLQHYHGYPHHYFNATHQGIKQLFGDNFEESRVYVNHATHPIYGVEGILKTWAESLTEKTRKKFEEMTVADLIKPPSSQLDYGYCTELSDDNKLKLACATILEGRKR